MYTICIQDSPQQFDVLLARLHQQSMLIFVTIVLGHPKSALEFFNNCRDPHGAFFRLFLAGPLLDCSKAVYIATTSKTIDLGYLKD